MGIETTTFFREDARLNKVLNAQEIIRARNLLGATTLEQAQDFINSVIDIDNRPISGLFNIYRFSENVLHDNITLRSTSGQTVIVKLKETRLDELFITPQTVRVTAAIWGSTGGSFEFRRNGVLISGALGSYTTTRTFYTFNVTLARLDTIEVWAASTPQLQTIWVENLRILGNVRLFTLAEGISLNLTTSQTPFVATSLL